MYSAILLLALLCAAVTLQIIWYLTDPRPHKDRWKVCATSKSHFFLSLNAVCAVLVTVTTLRFPLPPTRFDGLAVTLGVLMCLVGFATAVWAKLTIGEYWGPPAQHVVDRQHRLITGGPYARTRNPIYLGILLFGFGLFLALRSYLIFLAVIYLIYFYRAALKEEDLLEKQFGAHYVAYKSRTARFLVKR